MGFSADLVLQQVDEELICPICYDVLEDPYTACNECHLFCDKCMTTIHRCPMDRGELTMEPLFVRPVANLIAKLKVGCDSVVCDWTGRCDVLRGHETKCLFQKIHCDCGCATELPRRLAKAHIIRNSLQSLYPQIGDTFGPRVEDPHQRSLEELESQLAILKNELCASR